MLYQTVSYCKIVSTELSEKGPLFLVGQFSGTYKATSNM